ncbi:MAG: hypothetical protein ABIE36_01945 [Candidatus Diapherotrites archaeon]
MNLIDELTKEQAPKFQINFLNKEFIEKTLSDNQKGIFNLNSGINKEEITKIMNYMRGNYKNHDFELNYDVTNYEIMFKKKGDLR